MSSIVFSRVVDQQELCIDGLWKSYPDRGHNDLLLCLREISDEDVFYSVRVQEYIAAHDALLANRCNGFAIMTVSQINEKPLLLGDLGRLSFTSVMVNKSFELRMCGLSSSGSIPVKKDHEYIVAYLRCDDAIF